MSLEPLPLACPQRAGLVAPPAVQTPEPLQNMPTPQFASVVQTQAPPLQPGVMPEHAGRQPAGVAAVPQ